MKKKRATIADNRKKESLPKITDEEIRRKIETLLTLTDTQKAILSLKVRHPSISVQELADRLGMSKAWISELTTSIAFRTAMAEYTRSLMDVLVDAQTEAVKLLKRELKNSDAQIAISAAKALLMPLGRMEASPAVQQNIVYSVRFGDDGQLIRGMQQMKPDEFILDKQ